MSDAMVWFEVDNLDYHALDAMLGKPEDVYHDLKSQLLKSLERASRAAFDKRAALNHTRATAEGLGIKLSERERALLKDGESASPDQRACSGIRWRWSQELADKKALYAGVAAPGARTYHSA